LLRHLLHLRQWYWPRADPRLRHLLLLKVCRQLLSRHHDHPGRYQLGVALVAEHHSAAAPSAGVGYHHDQRGLVLLHLPKPVPRVHLQKQENVTKQLSRRSCSTASTHPSAVRGPTQVPPHLPPHHLRPHLPQCVVHLQKQENVTEQLSRRSCSTASTHPSAVRGPPQVPPRLPQRVLLLPCLHACARERHKTTVEAQLLDSITANKSLLPCQRTQELRYRHFKLAHDAFVSELGNGGACGLHLDQVAIIAYIVYPRRPTRPGLNVTP